MAESIQSNLDLLIQDINEKGYKFEQEASKEQRDKNLKLALAQYGSGIARIQKIEPDIKFLLEAFEKLESQDLHDNVPINGKPSEIKRHAFTHAVDVIIIGLLKGLEKSEFEKIVKDQFKVASVKASDGFFEKINNLRNASTPVTQNYAWTFSHYATVNYQKFIYAEFYYQIDFNELYVSKCAFAISLILNETHLWTWAQLGELYRYMGVLSIGSKESPFLYQFMSFTLSLNCFSKVPEPNESSDMNMKKLSLWSLAHAGGTICNFRQPKLYGKAGTNLTTAFTGWFNATKNKEFYSWASAYLGTNKALIVQDHPDRPKGTHDMIRGIAFLVQGILIQINLLEHLVEPAQLTRSSHVASTFTMLINHFNHPRTQVRPDQIEVAKNLCKDFFDLYQFNHNKPSEIAAIKLPRINSDLLNLGRAIYYYSLAQILNKETDKHEVSRTYITFMNQVILLLLIFENKPFSDTDTVKINPSADFDFRFFWNTFFVEFTEQERVSFTAETIYYLLEVRKRQAVEFEDIGDFLKQLVGLAPLPAGMSNPEEALAHSKTMQTVFVRFFEKKTADKQRRIFDSVVRKIPQIFTSETGENLIEYPKEYSKEGQNKDTDLFPPICYL